MGQRLKTHQLFFSLFLCLCREADPSWLIVKVSIIEILEVCVLHVARSKTIKNAGVDETWGILVGLSDIRAFSSQELVY